MSGADQLQTMFVVTAFLIQIVLIVHFALRNWRFEVAMRYGRLVYALSVPAALASLYLLLGGMESSFWIGGFIYLTWAIFGYTVEYRMKIEWRSPIYWQVFLPYVGLYLAMIMFYWWPLALIRKPLWFIYAALFILNTILNLSSHKGRLIHAHQGAPINSTRI